MIELLDLIKMVKKGVTASERKDQLRYETDKEGNIWLDPTGERKKRDLAFLKRYAMDPKGIVGLKPGVSLFWNDVQIIDAIMAAEKAKGYILTPQEKKKRGQQPSGTPDKAKQEALVGTVRTIRRINSGPAAAAAAPATPAKAAPAKAGGARVRGPATNKKFNPATESAPADLPAVAAPAFDMEEFIKKVDEIISARVQEAVATIVEELKAVPQNTSDALVDDLTLLHDSVALMLDKNDQLLTAGDPPMTIRDLASSEGEAEGDQGNG